MPLTASIFKAFRKALPSMSETERAALEAGTVWIEADLFRGKPNFARLMALPKPLLTAEEQSFLDNEVEEACRMVNDWQIIHQTHDMPPEAWKFIKDKGFLGMIIPKQYGGLGFSAYGHSEVIAKLSTRSSPLAVSVMVPNSLGPAELLMHYGTEAQKSHYLPRLAKGLEIPAFALTSPWAGSDAAAIPDVGVVCKGQWQGKEVVGMRVTWNKRYITLAPVCTILGLAFRLYDPDHLLGAESDLGITCALVPREHPGVQIGRRHIPLHTYFMNGPTEGHEVFMPLDFIIGGPKMAGQGWRMLMECLSAGRAISLPSANAGISQLVARYVGGYARVRSQFKTPIARFEGIEEAMARIAGYSYMNDAVRTLSAQAIDLGERPSVVSAIAKYHVTERARSLMNDGMDIVGGKGICLGPQNILGVVYQQMPVSITVEGANILTRSLILFGQGAIRCHPYVLKEMQAAQDQDLARGQRNFGQAFWRHVGYTIANGARAKWHGWTGGIFATPNAPVAPLFANQVRRLHWYSVAFAYLADLAMLSLGGSLKRKEKISARLGDILSLLFIASCVIKKFESEGRRADHAAVAQWAVEDCLHKTATAFRGVLANFPNRALALGLRLALFPWGLRQQPPSDALGRDAARSLTQPGDTRDALTRLCFLPKSVEEPLGALEEALRTTIACEPIDAKIRAAEKAGRFKGAPRGNVRDLPGLAHELGVISDEEAKALATRDALRDRVIHVDDFPFAIRVEGNKSDTDADHDSAGALRRTTNAGDGHNAASHIATDNTAAIERKVA
ncbi:MAG: acyl-CoA dehydrogenase [Burkholderiaceae bacterium]